MVSRKGYLAVAQAQKDYTQTMSTLSQAGCEYA